MATAALAGALGPWTGAAEAAHRDLRPTSDGSWAAQVVRPTFARSAPRPGAAHVERVGVTAAWNGGEVRLLVLDARRDRTGREWVRVRLPSRPNARSGWVDRDYVHLGRVRWRVTIDRRTRRARAYLGGRLRRSWRVVIGTPQTPTPRGLFAVYERVRQPAGSVLGPWALHLTAHSDTLTNYGGGPGRVALHGRAGALLADPLGSAASHGCVRMDDADVRWLARRLQPGTPVRIR